MNVVRHGLQLQLDIARLFRQLYAGPSQGSAHAKAPILLVDADAEVRPVLHLVGFAQALDARLAHDAAVDLRHQLHLVGAVGLHLQVFRFLLHGEGDLVRVGGEIVRLLMVADEVIQHTLGVRPGGVAKDTGPPVLQRDDLFVFHVQPSLRMGCRMTVRHFSGATFRASDR